MKKEHLVKKTSSASWTFIEPIVDIKNHWKLKSQKTEFKIKHDGETLFFLFKCEENNVQIDKESSDKYLVNYSDRGELFFAVDDELNQYYCLEIDPSGRVMDFSAKKNKDFDFNWKWPENQLKVNTIIEDDYYIISGEISLSSLKELHLLEENMLRVGIYRADCIKSEKEQSEINWMSWVNPNTEEPNFHIPTSFGVMKLEL